MVYEEYEAILNKIHKKEKELVENINKRENLFSMTQPKSSKFDKEIVDGKNPINPMEQYVIQKEYMNEKIEQLNQTLDDWYQILKRKREELKESKHPYDKIYYYFRIERLNIFKIAYLTNYSQSQIYRKLNKMGVKVKDAKKCEKKYGNMIM